MNFKTLKQVVVALIITACPMAMANDQFGLIPIPQSVEYTNDTLVLDKKMSLGVGEGIASDFSKMCASLLRDATGWGVPIGKSGTINLQLDQSLNLPEEGYKLEVTTQAATISASNQKGLFYGFQTLRQLMPPEAFSTKPVQSIKWAVPTVRISDAPDFSWRGILVDVSRKFQTKETIMKLLDGMAACKLNILHWHLTDDQGWRIEIKKYPKLTEVSKQFYTQVEIREVVKYAALRNITIVPEIDVPGHSAAASKAYPNLRCKLPDGSKSKRGNTYCPGEKFCYQFLEDVLTEVAALFPSPYIHLGADEVGHGGWKKCPNCQAFMKGHKLKNLHGLETHFVQTVVKIVRKLGKKPITWDEAFNNHCQSDQVIMSWRGVGPGIAAAEKGHKVVLCPVSALYFDRTNSRSCHQNRGYSINTVNLNLVYFFEAHNPMLSKEADKNILGAQGCIWGEKIRNGKHLMMQSMMRGCALAESTWSGAKKRNWNSFLKRASIHRKRLDALGVAYFWEPMSNAIELTQFKPGTLTKSNGQINLDISKQVTRNGMYEFNFHRYCGEGTYKVKEIALLQNGKMISKDKHVHKVTVDPRRPNQFYHLWVRDFKPGKKYELKVKAEVIKADNFTGAIMLIPVLNKDQYSWWSKPESGANGQK